jgi:DDE family transposase
MDVEAVSAKPRLRLLLDHFAKIKDTRQAWKVAYPLREVLFLVVCGTIASGDDYEDIVDWGKLRSIGMRLVEPATLGDPMRPLIWVSKSREKLAAELTLMGHPIGPDTVGKELVKLGFSRQFNRKADEGSHHPDRNAQFEHINAKVTAAQAKGQPVISVDTKKKERIGNFKNGGTDYCPKGKPRRVKVHDFEDKKRGKVVPYGVYDMFANAGFVSLGITSDTAEFAVQSIRCWRDRMGRARYPTSGELTITADCGGEAGSRVTANYRRNARPAFPASACIRGGGGAWDRASNILSGRRRSPGACADGLRAGARSWRH